MRGLSLAVAMAWLSAGAARAETYALAPAAPAEVRFTVEAPLDAIVGSSSHVSGEVAFEAGTAALGGGQVKVDASTFHTGIALRDEDLRDQFLEVQRFPEIVLTLQKLSRLSAPALAPGARLDADLTGTLSLHGQTRGVTFPVAIERSADGNVLAVRGSFDVTLADFGIQRPRKLFLKLGELAKIDLRATFATRAAAAPAPSAAFELPPPPPVARANARKSVPKELLGKLRKHEVRFLFPAETAAGRGERLLHDPALGGPGNALACASCNSTQDERAGLLADGAIKPSSSLFDVARRPTLWQGLASTTGKASTFCAKMFMLRPEGLSAAQEADLAAYLERLSPDQVAPPLDFRPLFLTKKSELAHPTDGNARNGERLLAQHCEACHAIGAPRPPLTPGLYEADYLVQRVRRLAGNDAHQMPPLTLDRLTDAELRDIVTYLAGNPSERIFRRNRPAHASR